MALNQNNVGCTDQWAYNFNAAATIPCDGCCRYHDSDIISPWVKIGCTDRWAINYDKTANYSCTNCCRYKDYEEEVLGPLLTTAFLPNDGSESGGGDDVPTFDTPYDIIPTRTKCITDYPYNDEWTKTDSNGLVTYGTGFDAYKQDLLLFIGNTTPNWPTGGQFPINRQNELFAALDRLLEEKPNARPFVNSHELIPWIIPAYVSTNPTLTPNPHTYTFENDCTNAGGVFYSYTVNDTSGGSTINDDSYIRNHFHACICQDIVFNPVDDNPQDNVQTDPCAYQRFDPITNTIIPPDQVLTKAGAVCCDNIDKYLSILSKQRSLGWDGKQGTTFFNPVIFENMGISVSESLFIYENIYNYDFYYVINGITSTTSSPITGRQKALGILSNAFQSPNAYIWLPTEHSYAIDIIHKRTCCEVVNGYYYEGTYQRELYGTAYAGTSYSVTTPTGNFVETIAGVCKCNPETLDPPCPTLAEVGTKTETLENGTVIQIVDVSEECCNNASLQTKMPGNWSWDGTRCVYSITIPPDDTPSDPPADTQACHDSTIITINETPININGITCGTNSEDNIITVSAYMYFEEPGNQCTDGVLTTSSPLTEQEVNLLENPPVSEEEIGEWSIATWGNMDSQNNTSFIPTTQTQNTKCCYDTSTPIQANLVIQNQNFGIINSPAIVQVDTFTSTQTNIVTNTNIGQGFNRWVRLTTTIDLNTFTPSGGLFNIAVEFTQGLFECCDYNIYFDDIEVGCLTPGFIERIEVQPCIGFDLSTCVIDNKKSWVYNPGTEQMSDTVYDNMVRNNGSRGMNIEQTGIIRAGGHGPINRVFAPSVDAELDFRDTDYFNFHGVIERHSKLVLNTKHLIVQFNMCPDNDCILGSYGYLTDDDGTYILDDDGGRIIVQDEVVPFPNLIQLEQFKKTFQSFWVQIIEQFIPATTIFVSGEKWCNNRICEDKVVADYLLDSRDDDLSPTPVVNNVTQAPTTQPPVTPQPQPLIVNNPGTSSSTSPSGTKSSTSNLPTKPSPVINGNYRMYPITALDPPTARLRIKLR